MSDNKTQYLPDVRGLYTRAFNRIARWRGYQPIKIEEVYTLFGADPKKRDITELRKKMDETISLMTGVSKRINPFASENLFMEALLELRQLAEDQPAERNYIYPLQKAIVDLYYQKGSFLDRFTNYRGSDINQAGTSEAIREALFKGKIGSFSEALNKFLEPMDIENLHEEIEPDSFIREMRISRGESAEPRTWDRYMVPDGMTKVRLQDLYILFIDFEENDSDANTLRSNMIEGFDKVIGCIESYAEASPKVAELGKAFHEIQTALHKTGNFYDPRYALIPTESLETLYENRHLFFDLSRSLREKRERVDGMPAHGSSFQEMAQMMYRLGTHIEYVARVTLAPPRRANRKTYQGPRPPQT